MLRQPCSHQPLSERAPFAVELDEPTAPPIVGLYPNQHPAAVPWRVMTVVVNAFQRVQRRRSRPHVAVERCEILAPRIAHRDAAATIVRIVCPFRITASRLHARPHSVLGDVRQSVRSIETTKSLPVQTPATLRVAGVQIDGADHGHFAARASTLPANLPSRIWRAPLNCQAPKHLAGQIVHRASKVRVSSRHSMLPEKTLNVVRRQAEMIGNVYDALARFIERRHLFHPWCVSKLRHSSIVLATAIEVTV